MHYFDNGTIAPVRIDAAGVGGHTATHTIEAEEFASLSGAARKGHDIDGRFFVRIVGSSARLEYTHVISVPRSNTSLLLRVSARTHRSTISAYYKEESGATRLTPLCSVDVLPTGVSWDEYAAVWCQIDAAAVRSPATELHLVLVVDAEQRREEGDGAPGEDDIVRLDSFVFAAGV